MKTKSTFWNKVGPALYLTLVALSAGLFFSETGSGHTIVMGLFILRLLDPIFIRTAEIFGFKRNDH